MTGNSKIPRLKFRIPRINSRILEFLEIASVALLPRNDTENSRIPKINSRILKLEFPILMSSPDLRFAVILGLDPRISSQRILKSPSLRGSKATEAISFKIPKQSHSRLNK